jgi:hypothetical protein
MTLISPIIYKHPNLFDRIERIDRIFSHFPDETEKGGFEKQKRIPVYPVNPV